MSLGDVSKVSCFVIALVLAYARLASELDSESLESAVAVIFTFLASDLGLVVGMPDNLGCLLNYFTSGF